MKRILIATDGSAAAREAVDFGIELASHEEADVSFVHVVPLAELVSANGFGLVGSTPYDPTEWDRQLLVEVRAAAAKLGVHAEAVLLRGEPVAAIVAYADSMNADLVVVGSRGHGALASALLGSVSRGILAHSKRPILIVRAAHVAENAAV